METDRSREFNPVKNATGDDSPQTAQDALLRLHRGWLHSVGAMLDEQTPVEISPLFALDADELRAKVTQWTQVTEPTFSPPPQPKRVRARPDVARSDYGRRQRHTVLARQPFQSSEAVLASVWRRDVAASHRAASRRLDRLAADVGRDQPRARRRNRPSVARPPGVEHRPRTVRKKHGPLHRAGRPADRPTRSERHHAGDAGRPSHRAGRLVSPGCRAGRGDRRTRTGARAVRRAPELSVRQLWLL